MAVITDEISDALTFATRYKLQRELRQALRPLEGQPMSYDILYCAKELVQVVLQKAADEGATLQTDKSVYLYTMPSASSTIHIGVEGDVIVADTLHCVAVKVPQ